MFLLIKLVVFQKYSYFSLSFNNSICFTPQIPNKMGRLIGSKFPKNMQKKTHTHTKTLLIVSYFHLVLQLVIFIFYLWKSCSHNHNKTGGAFNYILHNLLFFFKQISNKKIVFFFLTDFEKTS